jgi:hypothetical protein
MRPQLHYRLQYANRQLLVAIEHISKEWREVGLAPADAVSHETLPAWWWCDGRYYSRLTAEEIDEAAALLGTFAIQAMALLKTEFNQLVKETFDDI